MKLFSPFVLASFAAILPRGYATRTCDVHGKPYHIDHTISRDVCVIGGGSTGTYAAIRLKDAGKSVAVIEKVDQLGGHTQTYIDPATGIPVNLGVVVFHNTSLVLEYFARLNVSLTAVDLSASGGYVEYNDFRTGQIASNYTPSNPLPGLATYGAQLAKYPYVETGFDLPYPVPEDLLLSFGDFVEKYSLQSAMPFIYNFAQGLGDITSLSTLYVFKNFGSDILRMIANGGFLTAALGNNGLLYQSALAVLGTDVYLNSTIMAMDRSGRDHATIVVKTPTKRVEMQCKKIVFTIPPKLNNLHGFDLSYNETELFKKFKNTGYYTGLIRNSGIPDNTSVTNIGADTPFNSPTLPGIYSLTQTGIPGVVEFKYGSADSLNNTFVKQDILAATKRLQVIGKNASAEPELAIYYSHTPFECHVSAEEIKNGFYKKLIALQGQRRTWYTGGAFHTHDSSLLWAFTEALIPSILA
ncbi:hypothetical protein BP6252_04500 [Coleophoma cylindrospora]|uniref:Amine oxidase domain-containing protein n=1 Tax=Coleophoma cylindrospora TaxID=1849047 RepID=A0A3D8S0M2_9HELO|nr:hypothetical protein BP6252_04500 [Coleophoma cylindrospora]